MTRPIMTNRLTGTNVFLAILYTLGAIVVGVPVLAVLLVLDLAVLAVGAACGAGGVA